MNYIIRVENLGKKYILDHQSEGQQYLAFRDVLMDGAKKFCRRLIGYQDNTGFREHFWALKDVSFEVNRGERIGIIGRNGAGKSTLLKILSRITEPTTGRVKIKGRVASLLEVGTGFHPELTGRENIFLNGAILGMGRVEIRNKFDEIVDFAEIEKFLDTPVKRYSSGMYVRLAFAVAAHLEPEILVVDEVLAVGDAKFQKKCLGKMEDVSARDGRTVLFVSHNMQAIRHLCSRVLLFESGNLGEDGNVPAIIAKYLNSFGTDNHASQRNCAARQGRIESIRFFNSQDQLIHCLTRGEVLRVKIECSFTVKIKALEMSMAVLHGEGTPLFSSSLLDQYDVITLNPGRYLFTFNFPTNFFKFESYALSVYLFDGSKVIYHIDGVPLPELSFHDTDSAITEAHRWGVIVAPVSWERVVRIEQHVA